VKVVGLNKKGKRVSVFSNGVGFGEEFLVELSSTIDDDLVAIREEVVGGVPMTGKEGGGGEFKSIASGGDGG